MPKGRSKNGGHSSGLWDKVDLSVLRTDSDNSTPTTNPKKEKTKKERRKQRRRIVILDTCGVIIWLYTLLKLFVIDIDRVLVEAIVPSLSWLLDYRLLAYLCLVALLLTVLTRAKGKKFRIVANLLYVTGFPLVVLCWKLPRLLYRRRSWLATFGAVNILATAIYNYKFYFVTYLIVAIGSIMALGSESRSIIIGGTGGLTILSGILIIRAIRLSLQKSSFVTVQRNATIKAIKYMESHVALQAALKKPQIRRFNKKQVELIRERLSLGMTAVAAAKFWAGQIDQYRKSGTYRIFALVSYVWLFVEIVALSSIVNSAIFALSPSSFDYRRDPTLLEFTYYSFNALVSNEIEVLKPIGTPAIAAKLALGFIGVIILAIVGVYFLMDHRNVKKQQEYDEASRALDSAANSMSANLYRDYQLSPNEALEKLRLMGSTLAVQFIEFMEGRESSTRD
jgi:hypothetical protein